jgi:hypothetical protein
VQLPAYIFSNWMFNKENPNGFSFCSLSPDSIFVQFIGHNAKKQGKNHSYPNNAGEFLRLALAPFAYFAHFPFFLKFDKLNQKCLY